MTKGRNQTREKAIVGIRAEAGFDAAPGFTESLEMCLWLLASVRNLRERRVCASQFRRVLITLPEPEYPH